MTAELSNDEDEPSEEEKKAQPDGDVGSGGQLIQDPKSSKRSPLDSVLRKSSRLAQRRQANNTQQRFRISDGNPSAEGNFLAARLENEDKDK